MTTRLTNELRTHILGQLLDHKFKAKEQEHKSRESDLALSVYKTMYTEEQIAKMNALPDGWLEEVNYFRCYIRGRSTHMDIATGSVRVPHDHDHYYDVPVDSAVAKAWALLENDREALREARVHAYQAAGAALRQAYSVEKLVTLWPEVKPFVPQTAVPQVVSLALPIPQLNMMLGLP